MDSSPPGSSVYGISQARILEWAAISFSTGSSWPRDQTHVSCIGRQILYHWATKKAHCLHCFVYMCTQSCPTLHNPMDCSPLGSSVHGILQAWILECVAISYCWGSSRPRDQTHISCISCTDRQILYTVPPGSPIPNTRECQIYGTRLTGKFKQDYPKIVPCSWIALNSLSSVFNMHSLFPHHLCESYHTSPIVSGLLAKFLVSGSARTSTQFIHLAVI